jgi:hypothetical protein
LRQSFNKIDVEVDFINKYTTKEYLSWHDKSVAGRLYKPVDPEHVGLSGCKAKTFMGFFEGIFQKLILYERHVNPVSKAGERSIDKNEDEEFMKKTADYNDLESESPKRERIDSIHNQETGIIQTQLPRRNSSPNNKAKQFKKMTDEVAEADTRNFGRSSSISAGAISGKPATST